MPRPAYKNLFLCEKKRADELEEKYNEVLALLEKNQIEKKQLSTELNFVKDKLSVYSQNIGENDERQCIKMIYYMNQDRNFQKLVEIFGDEASDGIEILDPNKNVEIVHPKQIVKSKSSYKADIILKMKKTNKIYHPSIKSYSGALPAILNHTHRGAKVFQKGPLKSELHNIDKLIKEYIEKRKNGTFKEDVPLSKLDLIKTEDIYNSIVKMISLFIFNWSGSKKSNLEADSILVFDKTEITFLSCQDEEQKINYTKSILNRCIISLRSKGTPKKLKEEHNPWLFDYKTQSKKASLHIRIGKT